MIKGAIFDVDGTLLDSMHVWNTMGERYLKSIGYEPKPGLNEIFKTFSLYEAACYYIKEYGVALSADEIMEGVNSMVERSYMEDVKPKPHIIDFLERLKAEGVRMCVATATDEYLVRAALKRNGMDGYFSRILTCTEVGSGKTEPEIFRQALAHLGTDRENTVVFEDSYYALSTAKEDGFIVAGIYDACEKNSEEMRKAADIYITDYSDEKIFKKLSPVG